MRHKAVSSSFAMTFLQRLITQHPNARIRIKITHARLRVEKTTTLIRG